MICNYNLANLRKYILLIPIGTTLKIKDNYQFEFSGNYTAKKIIVNNITLENRQTDTYHFEYVSNLTASIDFPSDEVYSTVKNDYTFKDYYVVVEAENGLQMLLNADNHTHHYYTITIQKESSTIELHYDSTTNNPILIGNVDSTKIQEINVCSYKVGKITDVWLANHTNGVLQINFLDFEYSETLDGADYSASMMITVPLNDYEYEFWHKNTEHNDVILSRTPMNSTHHITWQPVIMTDYGLNFKYLTYQERHNHLMDMPYLRCSMSVDSENGVIILNFTHSYPLRETFHKIIEERWITLPIEEGYICDTSGEEPCDTMLEFDWSKRYEDSVTYYHLNNFSRTIEVTENPYVVDTKDFEEINQITFGTRILNLLKFPCSNLTSCNGMFWQCIDLTSICEFDTSNVTDMTRMFANCRRFTELDLSWMDVSKVTTMDSMFNQCENLETLDLSGWDLSNANASYIFGMNDSLRTIYMRGCNQSTISKIENALVEANIRDNVTIITE